MCIAALACTVLISCAALPIGATEDVCSIFRAKKNWHKTAVQMQRKWELPLHVPMAIMHQESKFRRKAKPPRRYVLGIIPWKRPSTAYGYAQALDGTWASYIEETNNRGASRTRFKDALDFMGWYLTKSTKINNISKDDTYQQYLAYHEGWTGFKRRSYEQKKWLKEVATNVDDLSKRYESQYASCSADLDKGFWRRLF